MDSLKYLRGFYQGDKGLETQVDQKTQSIDPREIYALELDDKDLRARPHRQVWSYLENQTSETDDPIRVSLPRSSACGTCAYYRT
ncbi:MAG: hypothetical protein U0528_19210 [Anaerolineae bacterium]